MRDRKTALHDLRSLVTCCCVVPIVWLLLGWRWTSLVTTHDAVLHLVPIYDRLLAARGDWSTLLYDPAWLGGTKVHDVLGLLPLHQLLARLGVPAIPALNLTAFLVQVIYGFLAIQVASDLRRVFHSAMTGGDDPADAPRGRMAVATEVARIAQAVLFCFLPVLGWRIIYGHLLTAMGALYLLIVTAVLLRGHTGKASIPFVLLILIALLHVFPHFGQQCSITGVIFGAPLVGGLLLCLRSRHRGTLTLLASVALLSAGAVLAMSLHLGGMLHHYLGPDALRSLTGEAVTFSYMTSTAGDWIRSIPWGMRLVEQGGRDFWLWHECNYPAGPLLLLCGMSAHRRLLPLHAGIALSVALVIAFSTNMSPISDALLQMLPPLRMFRVPARAMLPLLLVISPVGVAALLARSATWTTASSRRAWLLVLVLLPCLLNEISREIAAWLLAVMALAAINRPALRRWVAPEAILLLLALVSVLALHQRLLSFAPQEALRQLPARLRGELKRVMPEVDRPLHRVQFDLSLPWYGMNSAYAVGLPSIAGMGVPTPRFGRLAAAVYGVRYEVTETTFPFQGRRESFDALRALYNVRVALFREGTGLRLHRYPQVTSAAWFAHQLKVTESYDSLARELRGAFQQDRLTATAWMLQEDAGSARPALAPPTICQRARIEALEAGTGAVLFKLKVQVEGACPLILSMNYVSTVQAEGTTAAGPLPMQTFPVDGALLGVIVPPDAREVTISARRFITAWSWVAVCAGLFFLLAGAALLRRSGA